MINNQLLLLTETRNLGLLEFSSFPKTSLPIGVKREEVINKILKNDGSKTSIPNTILFERIATCVL